MFCPVCDQVKMREVEKNGVMIDICPSCKGVWLDRGELDKLMEGVREIRSSFNEWYEQEQAKKEQVPAADTPPPASYRPDAYSRNPYEAYKKEYDKSDYRDPHYRDPYHKDPYYRKDPYYKDPCYYKKYRKKKNVLDILGDLFD